MAEQEKGATTPRKPRRSTKKAPAARARSKAVMKNPQVLKIAGEKPLTIDGEMLLTATSHRPGPSLWFEINIFQLTGSEGFAVQTIAYKKTDDEKDVFRAFMLPSLEAVMDHIENYDPMGDVDVDHPKDGAAMGHAEVTLRTLMVRQRIEEARSEYRGLAGDVLYHLATQMLKAA